MDEQLTTKRTIESGAAASATTSPEPREFRGSAVPCATTEALKYSTSCRQIAFLLDTGCRVNSRLTHSKQTIGVPLTRHRYEGRSAHLFAGFPARKVKMIVGGPLPLALLHPRDSWKERAASRHFLIDTDRGVCVPVVSAGRDGRFPTDAALKTAALHSNLHSKPCRYEIVTDATSAATWGITARRRAMN